jgi:hypothetical protein
MKLLEELNVYLKGKNMNDDYWYDNALFVCQDILEKFTLDDWECLKAESLIETETWKKRLVECLGSFNNINELEIILNIVDTKNEDLFISAIDALRCVNLSELNIEQKEEILKKVKVLLPKSSLPVKKIFEEFIQKIN